jgi:hypothetical protein
MSGVARDVLDFLNGKYGLKSGAIAGSESLRAAVQELESESQRILREDPVLAFAYGVVDGGAAPQGQPVTELIRKARQLEPPTGADFTINPVFLLAGTIRKPDWLVSMLADCFRRSAACESTLRRMRISLPKVWTRSWRRRWLTRSRGPRLQSSARDFNGRLRPTVRSWRAFTHKRGVVSEHAANWPAALKGDHFSG